jgi:hypothetical protein
MRHFLFLFPTLVKFLFLKFLSNYADLNWTLNWANYLIYSIHLQIDTFSNLHIYL